jgi:hypothetical protein
VMIFADWEDIFQSLPGILTVTFLFGGWIIVAVVSSVTKNWRKVHESEHAAALKQSMIERGMSAEDIERVLRAGPESLEESGRDSGKDDATKLSEKLVEHETPAPVMEQIVSIFCTASPGAKKSLEKTIVAMLDGGADSQQVLAVVRALSRSTPAEQPQDRRYTDDAASFKH